MINLGPNKIKVLVLRQRRPLKISADGTFLLPYRKKIAVAPYFWRRKQFKVTAKFKFSSVPVMRTSFDKHLNDWSIGNESKNSALLRVKTLSSSSVLCTVTWTILPVDRVNTIVLFVWQNSRIELGLRYFFKPLKIKTKYKNPSHGGLEIKTKIKTLPSLPFFFKSIVWEPEHFS